MNKRTTLFLVSILIATTSIGHAKQVEADIDGASVGTWTMDLTAAKELAAEKKLPLLLDFSGSDWCSWCKVMEENVFTQPEWTTYATNHLVMVLIDFPRDKSLVPEKYAARNEALQMEYDVQGFPTFIVLDEDGETELGRLTAGREKTPASFQEELNVLFLDRPASIAKYAESLSDEARVEFDALNREIAEQQAASKVAKEAIVAAAQHLEEIEEAIAQLEIKVQDFRVSQLGEAQQKTYKDLKNSFENRSKELSDWLETQPEHSEENIAKFEAIQSDLQAIAAQLDTY